MSNIAWQVPVSYIRCQVSYVKYIAVYHVVKVTVTMTRHITVIVKHIAIQKMYSHNDKIDACSKETVLP